MGTRPLRQHYDPVISVVVAEGLGAVIEPWRRHRLRFAQALPGLSDDQWSATTRCTRWDAAEVVSHLVTADAFWVASLQGAASGAPTSFLAGFDPASSPQSFVDSMRSLSRAQVMEQFAAGTDAFIAVVEGLDQASWESLGESPVGWVPARLILAHALWDSWLHERDIFVPLGFEVPVEADELLVCTWYTVVMGGVQGGLLDDPSPVGPGPREPLDVTVVFEELPDDPLRILIDQGVQIERGSSTAAACGSALDLIETYTGRRGDPRQGQVPRALADQLGRALEIL